jgi:hypothetical protein
MLWNWDPTGFVEFFILFIFFILQKYTMAFKFSKTILQPSYPMAVGTNRHGPQRLHVPKYQLSEAKDDFK